MSRPCLGLERGRDDCLGRGCQRPGDGRSLQPRRRPWTATSLVNAPVTRGYVGRRLEWGRADRLDGRGGERGGSAQGTPRRPIPGARSARSKGRGAVKLRGVWTGRELIVWGGADFLGRRGRRSGGHGSQILRTTSANPGAGHSYAPDEPDGGGWTAAVFAASATGLPVPGFRWQSSSNGGASWTDLTNTAPYSGSDTAMLTVSPSIALNGTRYRVVATNTAGSATSNFATLTVTAPTHGARPNRAPLRCRHQWWRVRDADRRTGRPADAERQRDGDVDGDAESTVAACVSRVGHWVGDAVHERHRRGGTTRGRRGRCVDFLHVHRCVELPRTDYRDADAGAAGLVDTANRCGRHTGGQSNRRDRRHPVYGLGPGRCRSGARDDLPGGGVRESGTGRSELGGAAQIFVGVAVFIDGARPDVQAAFPNYPMNSRGGWGFMVLTNMLPDVPAGLPSGGNGTYRFFMYAQDREGQTTLLGTRTMTCANAGATLPFGAIDTPTQGGVASGTNFVNFGWALAQAGKFIPTDGSTIAVQVDGVSVGTVDYNHFRSDIAALFPGLANSSGAIGFRILDTTTMTNGVHTIVWVVRDNLGNVEGIGSRFFTVSNGVGAVTAVEGGASRRGRERGDAGMRAAAIAAAPTRRGAGARASRVG